MSVDARIRGEPLVPASLIFVAANIAHTIDHFRQGVGRLTTEVLLGGTMITVFAFVALFLALRRHPSAASVAAIVGFVSAIGISASHLTPHWGVFSDSYPDLGVDAAAWAIVFAEIAAGIFLGIVGLRQLRDRRSSA